MKLIFLFFIIGALVSGLVSQDVGDPGCKQQGELCGPNWGWCCGASLQCSQVPGHGRLCTRIGSRY